MAGVDAGYAAYLRGPARYVTTTLPDQVTRFGDKVQASTIISPIAEKAPAQAEATRQAQFLAGPIAQDFHIVKGQRRDLIARSITVIGDRLGYEAGVNVFVIGAAELDDGTTRLTVLKRL